MKNIDYLKDLMSEMTNNSFFPGATFSVTEGTNSMSGVVGYKSLIPKKELATIDTLYDMASLSKVIVTNTILTLALQENKINLNTKIGEVLTEYSYLDINIYDLATHSSGLAADFDIKNIHCNDDVMKQLKDIRLEYKTGTNVVYSDKGFILLGMILEKIYGKTLDEIAKDEIFKPLGMNNSTYYPDKEKCAPTEITEERGIVWGKTHDEKGYYSNNILGHAGLFCNIEDVNKFVQMILNEGVVNGKVYIKKEYLDLWFTPLEKEQDGTIRSIGWILGNTPNITGGICSNETLIHTGFTGTSLVIDRINNIGIVVLSNRVHPTRENKKLITGRKLITQCVYENIMKNNVNGKNITKKL